MGKSLISQKRGKGSSRYRVRQAAFLCRLSYKEGAGTVTGIIRDTGRTLPLAVVRYGDGSTGYLLAREGTALNQSTGDMVMPLAKIPESTHIFAIESSPNSGPVFCRAGGSAAIIVSKEKDMCKIQFPSKKTKELNSACRAIVGVPAGGGRHDKPWVKAGFRFKAKKARGQHYPTISANRMNAVNHPFGGSYSGVNKPKTCSRNAPPGRKVGNIAARRCGKQKK